MMRCVLCKLGIEAGTHLAGLSYSVPVSDLDLSLLMLSHDERRVSRLKSVSCSTRSEQILYVAASLSDIAPEAPRSW